MNFDMEDAQQPGTGDEDLIPGMAAMTFMEKKHLRIRAEDLLLMRGPVKSLVQHGKVFAVQETDTRRRTAKITICDINLYIHHLTDDPLPPQCYFIDYKDLMMYVRPAQRTFLDLGYNGTPMGRLIIRLHGATTAASQFAHLCSGKYGPSYYCTRLLEAIAMGEDMEYVVGGDYENNDGTGGKGISREIDQDLVFNQPWKAGTVWGFLLKAQVAGQFCILTKDNPGMVLSAPSFGVVEEGLNILQGVVQCFEDIRNVLIVNCGLVLPYPLTEHELNRGCSHFISR